VDDWSWYAADIACLRGGATASDIALQTTNCRLPRPCCQLPRRQLVGRDAMLSSTKVLLPKLLPLRQNLAKQAATQIAGPSGGLKSREAVRTMVRAAVRLFSSVTDYLVVVVIEFPFGLVFGR